MKKMLMWAAGALLVSGTALADPASGIRAYDAGLYDVAATEFAREAKAGDAEAQFRLGAMYADGVWLKKDRGQAMHWLGQAAIQGHQGAVKKLEAISAAENAKAAK